MTLTTEHRCKQSIELTRQLFSNRDSLLGILILFPITICGFHTTMSYDCFAICKTVAELACERFAKSCTFFRQDTERHIQLWFKSYGCLELSMITTIFSAGNRSITKSCVWCEQGLNSCDGNMTHVKIFSYQVLKFPMLCFICTDQYDFQNCKKIFFVFFLYYTCSMAISAKHRSSCNYDVSTWVKISGMGRNLLNMRKIIFLFMVCLSTRCLSSFNLI